MNELAERVAIICTIIVAVIGVILLATTPFALLGWVIMSIISLFTTITTSYFDWVAVGIGVVIIANITIPEKIR